MILSYDYKTWTCLGVQKRIVILFIYCNSVSLINTVSCFQDKCKMTRNVKCEFIFPIKVKTHILWYFTEFISGKNLYWVTVINLETHFVLCYVNSIKLNFTQWCLYCIKISNLSTKKPFDESEPIGTSVEHKVSVKILFFIQK